MNKTNLNEKLKKLEAENKIELKKEEDKLSLDSVERVKVLSPGRLVFNRFIRNRLAIIGSCVLIFMFVFSFLCPIFYPYTQTQIFYKYDSIKVNYAQASERSEYSVLPMIKDFNLSSEIKLNLNSAIRDMEINQLEKDTLKEGDGNTYEIVKVKDHVYALYEINSLTICIINGSVPFATYNYILGKITYVDVVADDEFETALKNAVTEKKTEFQHNNNTYELIAGKKGTYNVNVLDDSIQYTDGNGKDSGFEEVLLSNLDQPSFQYDGVEYDINNGNRITVSTSGDIAQVAYLTTFYFCAKDREATISDEFKIAIINAYVEASDFQMNQKTFHIKDNGIALEIYDTADEANPIAMFSTFVVKAYDGSDSLSLSYVLTAQEAIQKMKEGDFNTGYFTWEIPEVDENGKYVTDASGNILNVKATMNIENKSTGYVISCNQVTYLINIYAKPSLAHPVGTDGDGMDVLARMMYGGRVSLAVCFVVIIIENLIGVIMGGISGYFGGWIDNVIMRAVDVFYCIPSLPILIIIGALFDSMKVKPYVRLMWLMVILGVLGWAGVARLVRGQILSLREQEFMVATEAVGLKTSRRIFKHLVPNVMPQLIVTASNGLGDIIITESTLSFLGLGVKHPLATWGTMINSVTASSETMILYAYIWIPVGLLICLTVIAFNFLGDGLRDAFDPKMKR